MPLLAPRPLFALIALYCIGLLGYGYYLQYGSGIEPCPMCIFQRLCYFAIALVSGAAAIHGPRSWGVLVYGTTTVLLAGLGGTIAARQVWLQHLPPDQVPECGPGLEYLLEMYPVAEVVRMALRGTGECATVEWTFLGLSIAGWSLVSFSVIAVACIAGMIVHARGAARGANG